MEQLEKKAKWRQFWLNKLWTTILLVGALLTQNPQENHAQASKNIKATTEEVVNDSTIEWEFNPELIASIWEWIDNKFVIREEFLRKDEKKKEYITINWNNYYNADYLFLEDFSWLWYTQLLNYSRYPNWFFIGVITKNDIWSNWILIQPNWYKYQGHFEDGIYEGNWVLDFWDWRHYEWDFHEWEIEWEWKMHRANWDYYEWGFQNWKRSWYWNMQRKYWLKYQWDWKDDSPVKDPRHYKNPTIIGKWTYTYYWGEISTIEVSNWSRPWFISVDDKKISENWEKKRGTIVYIVKKENWGTSYELHSWNRDIQYELKDSHFVFSTKDWSLLKFSEKIWEKKAQAIANLINSVMNMVKNNDEWYWFYAFDYNRNTLQAQYRWKIFDIDLVKDIPWKIGISAKEFSDWLNHYRKDKSGWLYDF